jgi:hypothetical protein
MGYGIPCTGYSLPQANNSFSLNPVTGDLIWDAPLATGEYNVAFYIIEWRKVNGHFITIDSVERDMQITILNCSNNPPQFGTISDTCIFAGDTLALTLIATDPEGNSMNMTAYGSPLTITDPATFSSDSPHNPVTGHFDWNTKCHHIRIQPYTVYFRSQDVVSPPEVQLVDLENINIRVIAPAPQSLTATPAGNTIILNWNPGACATDKGYHEEAVSSPEHLTARVKQEYL